MNTTPTTSQVHAPGSRCCLFVFMIDRRFAQRSRNGRAGDADPSATKLGRIRALTPRVCRAAPSWWLGAGETRAIGGQVVRAGDFLHPLIRGDSGEIQGRFRGDSGEIPGSLRASIERLFDTSNAANIGQMRGQMSDALDSVGGLG